MRSGLWVSGAGGSGILVARKADGTWSPPSGILLHTAGLGFLVGVDIYDCVVVINTEDALKAFTKIRCTLGAEVSAVAGPVGAGGILESELHKRRAPVWTYLKSRGFYAGVQIDGTVIIERGDENERFYHERIGVADILAGKIRHPPYETRMLMQTIKAAQGDHDADEGALPSMPPPSDMDVEQSDHVFGVPDKQDPDPYGVLALEKQGLEIREAGSQSRPSSEQFDFRPSPTSPVFNSFNRKSVDSLGSRHRESLVKRQSVNRATQTEDLGTIKTPTGSPSQSPERKSTELAQESSRDTDEANDSNEHGQEGEEKAVSEGQNKEKGQIESVELSEPAQAAPQVITKARLVSIPKRIPPALPPRSPARRKVVVNGENGQSDEGTVRTSVDAGTSARSLSADAERDGWSEVALDGSAPSTNSVTDKEEKHAVPEEEGLPEEAYQPITMEDDEEDDTPKIAHTEVSAPTKNSTVDEPVSPLTPGTAKATMQEPVSPTTPIATKSRADESPGPGEDDDFHSIPSTPT